MFVIEDLSLFPQAGDDNLALPASLSALRQKNGLIVLTVGLPPSRTHKLAMPVTTDFIHRGA